MSYEKYLPIFKNRSRKRELVYQRHLVLYYMRTVKNKTIMSIEDEVGYDHSTVLHAVRNVENMLSINDPFFYNETKEIGVNLFPELYFKEKEVTEAPTDIMLTLKQMGVDTSSMYNVAGVIGRQHLTIKKLIEIFNNR